MAVPRMIVLGSFCVILAFIACGISFFTPYWLVTWPQHVEVDRTYPAMPDAASSTGNLLSWRGLWAECHVACQWFWQHDYQLQINKFTPLRWHLATQILYFIGAGLLLLCEVYLRAQLCCIQRKSVYRTLGIILFVSFVAQAAAVATFGGFSYNEYRVQATSSEYLDTYLGWSFWTAVAGSVLTMTAASFFVSVGCVCCCRRASHKSTDH